MDRNLSRRRFLKTSLGVAGGLAAANLLAACQPEPAKPAAGGAGQPAAAGKPATVSVWMGTDYVPTTNVGLKARWDEVGKANNTTVNFDEKTGNWIDQLIAAVQAGNPPDFCGLYDYQVQFFRSQDQSVDLTDLVKPYTSKDGGYYDYVESTCVWKNQWFASPWAVSCWPLHARQDMLDKENGGKWPATWDEFMKVSKAVNKPPNFYAYGYTMGTTADCNNHFLGTLWTFGGQLQNPDGTFGVKEKDPAWLETLELTRKMYVDEKIIPPGAVSWVDADNNTNYQGEQVAWTSNPTSIYVWLEANKPDLAKKTAFYGYPKGPKGSFGQVDVRAFNIFKASKSIDATKKILDGLLDPTWQKKFIADVKGRFVSVYKAHIDEPMWKSGVYKNYADEAKTGKLVAWAAQPWPAYSDITTNFLIGGLVQDVVVRKDAPDKALANFVSKANALYAKYKM